MKKWTKHILGLVAVLALSTVSFAQTSLTQTSLAAAVTSTSTTVVNVSSATGITAGQTLLYVDQEAMFVNAISGTMASVTRGYNGTRAFPHISGAMALVGSPTAFIAYDPSGACTNGQGLFLYSPVVNVKTGNQWLCSTVTGKIIPGFVNVDGGGAGVSTAVASAAAKITPSGPLFHITGTAAITGFNIPVGFDPKGGGQVCAIPDGIFTTTAANNIALASTAVVSKTLCWTYDANTAKFYPAY